MPKPITAATRNVQFGPYHSNGFFGVGPDVVQTTAFLRKPYVLHVNHFPHDGSFDCFSQTVAFAPRKHLPCFVWSFHNFSAHIFLQERRFSDRS